MATPENMGASILFLQNHGLVVASSTFDGAWYTTKAVSDICKGWILDRVESDEAVSTNTPAVFPDAVVFEENKKINEKIVSLMLSSGLTPKPLTEIEAEEIRSMEQEKYRGALQ